jgi:hypothetical protein
MRAPAARQSPPAPPELADELDATLAMTFAHPDARTAPRHAARRITAVREAPEP